jgi:hypothetical protein
MKNIDLLVNSREFIEEIIKSTIDVRFKSKRCFWAGTPFNHFIVLAPAKFLGIFGENLIDKIYTNMKKRVHPGKGGYDLLANNKRVEIKTSFIRENNRYRVCQIRPNADYDKIIFIFVSPEGIQFYQAKKDNILSAIKRGDLKSTHNDGTNKNTKLYIIDGKLEKIVNSLQLRNITNLMAQHYDENDIISITDKLIFNRMELKRHMIGSKFEDVSFAPSVTISKFGKDITKNVLKNCAIDWRQKDIKESQPEKPTYIVRTSFIGIDGNFDICQIRPNDDFNHMIFVAIEPDDIRIYTCPKKNVINATNKMNKQHNNGKRKPSLYNMHTTKENIIKLFNMREL